MCFVNKASGWDRWNMVLECVFIWKEEKYFNMSVVQEEDLISVSALFLIFYF